MLRRNEIIAQTDEFISQRKNLEEIFWDKKDKGRIYGSAYLYELMEEVCVKIEELKSKLESVENIRTTALSFFRGPNFKEQDDLKFIMPHGAMYPFDSELTSSKMQRGLVWLDSSDLSRIEDDLAFLEDVLKCGAISTSDFKDGVMQNIVDLKIFHLYDRCCGCGQYINEQLITKWNKFVKDYQFYGNVETISEWLEPFGSANSIKISNHFNMFDGQYLFCRKKWENNSYSPIHQKTFVLHDVSSNVPHISLKDLELTEEYDQDSKLKKLLIVGFWIYTQGKKYAVLPKQIRRYIETTDIHIEYPSKDYNNSIHKITTMLEVEKKKVEYRCYYSDDYNDILSIVEQARFLYCEKLCNTIIEDRLPIQIMVDIWSHFSVKRSILAIMMKVPPKTSDFYVEHPLFKDALFITHTKHFPAHQRCILSAIRDNYILLDIHFDLEGGKFEDIFFALLSTFYRFKLFLAEKLFFIADSVGPHRKAIRLLKSVLKGVCRGKTISLINNFIERIVFRYGNNTGADRFSTLFNEHDYMNIISYPDVISDSALERKLRISYLEKFKVRVYESNCMFHLVNSFVRFIVPSVRMETRTNFFRIEGESFSHIFAQIISLFRFRSTDFVYCTKRNKFLFYIIDFFILTYHNILKQQSIQEAEDVGVQMKEKSYEGMSDSCIKKEKRKWEKGAMERKRFKWFADVNNEIYNDFLEETLNFTIGHYEESVFNQAMEQTIEMDTEHGLFKKYVSNNGIPYKLEDLFEHIRNLYIVCREQVGILRRFLLVWSNLYGKLRIIFSLFFYSSNSGHKQFRDDFEQKNGIYAIFDQIETILKDGGGSLHRALDKSFTFEEIQWIIFFCFVVRKFRKLSLMMEKDSYSTQATIGQFHILIHDIRNFDVAYDNNSISTLPSDMLDAEFGSVKRDGDKAIDIKKNLNRKNFSASKFDSAMRCCMRGFKEMGVKKGKKEVGTIICNSGAELNLLQDVKDVIIAAFSLHLDKCINNESFYKHFRGPIPFWFDLFGKNSMVMCLTEDQVKYLHTPAIKGPIERVFSHFSYLRIGKVNLKDIAKMKMKLHKSLHHIVFEDSVNIAEHYQHVDSVRFRNLEEDSRKRTSSARDMPMSLLFDEDEDEDCYEDEDEDYYE
ncbi:hypothetical protein PCE1_003335 [Barthelona sp. PCE]